MNESDFLSWLASYFPDFQVGTPTQVGTTSDGDPIKEAPISVAGFKEDNLYALGYRYKIAPTGCRPMRSRQTVLLNLARYVFPGWLDMKTDQVVEAVSGADSELSHEVRNVKIHLLSDRGTILRTGASYNVYRPATMAETAYFQQLPPDLLNRALSAYLTAQGVTAYTIMATDDVRRFAEVEVYAENADGDRVKERWLVQEDQAGNVQHAKIIA